jgi:ribose 5-phosphate isomerase B
MSTPSKSPGPPSAVLATRVHLAGDHAAYELKAHLVDALRHNGYQVIDHGPVVFDADDDYPMFVLPAAEAVASDPGSLGVVLGGSGNGEQIAANKVAGIRAILAWNKATAMLGRQHNDANIISIGARQHTVEEAIHLVTMFLETVYSEDARHQRRINMISEYESSRAVSAAGGQTTAG